MAESPRVLAVVLTYAAPEALDRCLRAIASQTRQPDSILVVDNASPQPARPAAVDLPIEVLRLDANTGPAGGHADGLDRFLHSGNAFAWVMDDDCVPAPQCLERLLAWYDEAPADCLVFPWWIDVVTGEGMFRPAWCGFLVSRAVVEKVGLPRRDFVWWPRTPST